MSGSDRHADGGQQEAAEFLLIFIGLCGCIIALAAIAFLFIGASTWKEAGIAFIAMIFGASIGQGIMRSMGAEEDD